MTPAEPQPTTNLGPKDYLYVSDAKVDKLSGQLKQKLRDRFEVTVKGDLPGFGGVEVGPKSHEPNRYEQVERLCQVLEEDGKIGDLFDGTKEYIRGTVMATWGFWEDGTTGYADVVFFTSHLSSNAFLGMGGSAYHTEERGEERLQQHSNSGIRGLMKWAKANSQERDFDFRGIPTSWYHEMIQTDFDNDNEAEEVEICSQAVADI